MKIINCTSHAITISGKTFPPSGKVVSVKTERRRLANRITENNDEIPIYGEFTGELENFECPQEDEILIVSKEVKKVIKHCHFLCRGIVASPGNCIYDENGDCTGVDGLEL